MEPREPSEEFMRARCRFCFCWGCKYISLGGQSNSASNKVLGGKDMLRSMEGGKLDAQGDLLEAEWKRKLSLFQALWKVYGRRLALIALVAFVC